MALFVLFEHASGYTLFRVKEFEEVGMFLPEVEKSIQNFSHFCSIVQLIAFTPFKNASNALDNMNSISEGILHQDLQLFLETNLPRPGKKKSVILGVGDAKVGVAIQETLSYPCQHTGVVPEIIRGVRVHYHNLIKGLSDKTASKAQLGLGHSYSRAKVKFNVNRNDNMIIQSICLLDQLDKDINTFAMRVREWYSYHFPELVKLVPDNYMYAKVAKFIKQRKTLNERSVEELEEIVMDGSVAKAIFNAAETSIGMEISPIDLINIETFASRVIALADYRKELLEYLRSKMHNVAPNLAALIGETVGARLISHAGSLTNLAKYPASTVQILGAEKALFRALKTRGNTPKYGLIFHSTFIGRAGAKNKGRISRFLANKCSIASRIDCFSEMPNDVFGNKLKEQVEERLKFYETGEVPRKNVEVMKDAIEEASKVTSKLKKKLKKAKKKKKLEEESSMVSSAVEESNFKENETQESVIDDEKPQKKKKKKKRKLDDEPIASSNLEESVPNGEIEADTQVIADNVELPAKKKKKKKRSKQEESIEG
ncbi:nucleolar protein 56 isoform X2 [Centruroides vittatus]|uniref:nucleolar protein 56 isoform X2 n=1 Tax=Centruroides vittatus TaxID=120091 RepID=UPI00350F22DD